MVGEFVNWGIDLIHGPGTNTPLIASLNAAQFVPSVEGSWIMPCLTSLTHPKNRSPEVRLGLYLQPRVSAWGLNDGTVIKPQGNVRYQRMDEVRGVFDFIPKPITNNR